MEILASAATSVHDPKEQSEYADEKAAIDINSVPTLSPRNTSATKELNCSIGSVPAPPQIQQYQSIPIVKTDWRVFLTLEDRMFIREKIKSAYKSKTATYEELLETCCAIEEEQLFAAAPAKLDYFKSGVQYEKRVSEKRRQLNGNIMTESCQPLPSVLASTDKPTVKRCKTAH
jgi:hypothetical protein